MGTRTRVAALGLWLTAFSAACSGDDALDAASDGTGRTRAAIIHGSASTASEEDAVVALALRPGGALAGLCSGTLVAPNLVLTARHCVSATDSQVSCTVDGSPLQGGMVTSDHLADEVFVYRARGAIALIRADGNGSSRASARGKALFFEGSTLCNADLAFVLLDQDLPLPYAPIRLDTNPTKSETVTAVGYGRTESGDLPDVRQRRTGVSVTRVGRLLFNIVTQAGLGDSELMIGEAACSGDSGGPVLSSTTGALVGVTSRVGGGSGGTENVAGFCTGADAFGIYTHLAHKSALVAQAFAAAGHEPWHEGRPNPYDPSSWPDDAGADTPDAGHEDADAAVGSESTTDDAGADGTSSEGGDDDGLAVDAGARSGASDGDTTPTPTPTKSGDAGGDDERVIGAMCSASLARHTGADATCWAVCVATAALVAARRRRNLTQASARRD